MMTKIIIMMMTMMMAKSGSVTKNIENRDETRVWINGSDVHTYYTDEYEIGLFDTIHIDRDCCGTTEIDARVLMLIYGQLHGNSEITEVSLCRGMGYEHYYTDEHDDCIIFNYIDDDGMRQCVEMTEDELNECAKYCIIW